MLVLARVLRGRLIVTVADRGGGMTPKIDSPGLGLGLPIVSQLAGDVRIDSDERGAAVSMSFECAGAGEPGSSRRRTQAATSAPSSSAPGGRCGAAAGRPGAASGGAASRRSRCTRSRAGRGRRALRGLDGQGAEGCGPVVVDRQALVQAR